MATWWKDPRQTRRMREGAGAILSAVPRACAGDADRGEPDRVTLELDADDLRALADLVNARRRQPSATREGPERYAAGWPTCECGGLLVFDLEEPFASCTVCEGSTEWGHQAGGDSWREAQRLFADLATPAAPHLLTACPLPVVFADWNARDEEGRFRLDLAGSLPSLERLDEIRPGRQVIASDGELATVVALEWCAPAESEDGVGRWLGVPVRAAASVADDVGKRAAWEAARDLVEETMVQRSAAFSDDWNRRDAASRERFLAEIAGHFSDFACVTLPSLAAGATSPPSEEAVAEAAGGAFVASLRAAAAMPALDPACPPRCVWEGCPEPMPAPPDAPFCTAHAAEVRAGRLGPVGTAGTPPWAVRLGTLRARVASATLVREHADARHAEATEELAKYEAGLEAARTYAPAAVAGWPARNPAPADSPKPTPWDVFADGREPCPEDPEERLIVVEHVLAAVGNLPIRAAWGWPPLPPANRWAQWLPTIAAYYRVERRTLLAFQDAVVKLEREAVKDPGGALDRFQRRRAELAAQVRASDAVYARLLTMNGGRRESCLALTHYGQPVEPGYVSPEGVLAVWPADLKPEE